MNLWRSKRRYDTGRRFTDQADDALHALALLQSDDTVTKNRASELREKLAHGKTVLKTLRNALQHPEEADSYTYSVGRQLQDHYGDIDPCTINRLSLYLNRLDTAEATLSYHPGLNAVATALEIVEEITTKTTEQMPEFVGTLNS